MANDKSVIPRLERGIQKTSQACIIVEVVYVREQTVVSVKLNFGATLQKALKHSGLLEQFPQLRMNTLIVGVFGVVKGLSDLVRHGDRVEIYEPLLCDPKLVRRARAKGVLQP